MPKINIAEYLAGMNPITIPVPYIPTNDDMRFCRYWLDLLKNGPDDIGQTLLGLFATEVQIIKEHGCPPRCDPDEWEFTPYLGDVLERSIVNDYLYEYYDPKLVWNAYHKLNNVTHDLDVINMRFHHMSPNIPITEDEYILKAITWWINDVIDKYNRGVLYDEKGFDIHQVPWYVRNAVFMEINENGIAKFDNRLFKPSETLLNAYKEKVEQADLDVYCDGGILDQFEGDHIRALEHYRLALEKLADEIKHKEEKSMGVNRHEPESEGTAFEKALGFVDENKEPEKKFKPTLEPKPHHERISKIDYYLGIAKAVAQRGTCMRRKFGAVIVKDDRIVSTGYVGAPRGRQNCCDRGICFRQENNIPSGQRYELCRSVHAEMNAIINASKEELEGGVMYLVGVENDGTITPNADCCAMCKRVIINAGIRYVIVAKPDGKSTKIPVESWILNDDSLTIHEGY